MSSSPGPPERSTRDRLLAAAIRLLAERGLEGTGLSALTEASGATKGSLYHFFPAGKAQWVAEALTVYAARLRERLEAQLARAPTPGTAVAAFIAELAHAQEAQGFARGCPVGAVALDVAPEDPLADHCRALIEEWVAVLAPALRPGDMDDGRALATYIIASFEGALLLARVQRDRAPLLEAAKRLQAAVDGS